MSSETTSSSETKSSSEGTSETLSELLGLGQADLFQCFAEQATTGVYVDSVKSGCVYTNSAFQRLLGRTFDELLGFEWVKAIHRDDVQRMQAEIERFEKRLEPASVEYRVVRSDGSVSWVAAEVVAIRDSNGNHRGSVALLRDITNEQRVRRALVDSQRLEAVGRLSAGVAHDFNNLLTAVLASTDLISRVGDVTPAQERHLSVIADAVDRASRVTQQLLALSRHRVGEVGVTAVDDELLRMQPLIERTLGEQFDFQFEPGASSAAVKLVSGTLGQLIINLVVNARDAMPRGGRIQLATTVGEPVGGIKAGVSHRDHPWLRIECRDEGTGIDAETMESIFDPFFTTKEEGRGTGLGLSTVRNIVLEASGLIAVESVVGSGTTITIHLPFHDGIASQMESTVHSREQKHSGKVFFVEDEADVRLTVGQVLSIYGYEAITAATLADARELWSAHGKDVVAVVTDVVLGDGFGPELLEEFRRDAEFPVVYTSGYAGDRLDRIELARHDVEFLGKPYRPAQLILAIERVIESHRRAHGEMA